MKAREERERYVDCECESCQSKRANPLPLKGAWNSCLICSQVDQATPLATSWHISIEGKRGSTLGSSVAPPVTFHHRQASLAAKRPRLAASAALCHAAARQLGSCTRAASAAPRDESRIRRASRIRRESRIQRAPPTQAPRPAASQAQAGRAAAAPGPPPSRQTAARE